MFLGVDKWLRREANMLILTLALLGQSWGGEYTLKKTPLISPRYHQKIQYRTSPQSTPVQLYELMDNTGQVLKHEDWPTLWNYVQERNRQNLQQYYYPVQYYYPQQYIYPQQYYYWVFY